MARGFEVTDTFWVEGRGTIVAGHLVDGAVAHLGDALVDGEVMLRIRGLELIQTRPRMVHPPVGLLVDVPDGYKVPVGHLLDVQPPGNETA